MKEFKDLLKQVNEYLEKRYGARLVASFRDNSRYNLDVRWDSGSCDTVTCGDLKYTARSSIYTAQVEVIEMARTHGDKVIRVSVHVDLEGRFFHDAELCCSEEDALRFMNVTLPLVLDDGCTMASKEDLIAVNAALAERYDDPYNLDAYATWDDITEATIINCSEAFCEHHWSHKALVDVADELGIDLYDLEAEDG